MMWGELIAQIKEEELDKKTCSPKLTRNPHGIMKNGGSRRGETWRRKKAWQKKISSPRCPVSLSPSSTSTTNQGLKGQDVFEPLFFTVIAAQCRGHSQCWPVALSLELDRCYERFHFSARHKLTEYVMDPIHPDDLFVVPFGDMEHIYLSVISD